MSRLEAITARIRDEGLAALLVTTPANTYYLSRFQAETYTRPIVVVAAETPVLIVPELDEEHARSTSAIGDILVYSDRQTGRPRGLSHLHLALGLAVEALKDAGVHGPIGFESEGLSRGSRRKGSSRCAGVAACRPGTTKLAISAEATTAMMREGAARHPGCHVKTVSRPTSGPRSSRPHAMVTGRRLAAGDVAIHSSLCAVDGYCAEAQRTIFVEHASDLQRRLFAIMLRAGAAARAAIRPGVPCSEVDRAARTVIEEAGYGREFVHRTGHGIGIGAHELPFFGPGDDTELAPGMVMSVEPGIYVEGVGGFRHSDTVVVTDDGCEILTPYPREAEALIAGR